MELIVAVIVVLVGVWWRWLRRDRQYRAQDLTQVNNPEWRQLLNLPDPEHGPSAFDQRLERQPPGRSLSRQLMEELNREDPGT